MKQDINVEDFGSGNYVPILIERNYIRLLAGGGSHRGQTFVNLIVNGHRVHTAVGIGEPEDIDWIQWDVRDLTGEVAKIELVEDPEREWEKVVIERIVQSDEPLPNSFKANKRYLNIPVRSGAREHVVQLISEGLVVAEFNVELADPDPDTYVFLDLEFLWGKELLVRFDSYRASGLQLSTFILSDQIMAASPVYQETQHAISP